MKENCPVALVLGKGLFCQVGLTESSLESDLCLYAVLFIIEECCLTEERPLNFNIFVNNLLKVFRVEGCMFKCHFKALFTYFVMGVNT